MDIQGSKKIWHKENRTTMDLSLIVFFSINVTKTFVYVNLRNNFAVMVTAIAGTTIPGK